MNTTLFVAVNRQYVAVTITITITTTIRYVDGELTTGGAKQHPVHLHGHSFWVLYQGVGAPSVCVTVY